MPALLRRTLRRSIPAAISGLLLIVALPQAALAAQSSDAPSPSPSGLIAGGAVAAILILTAGLSIRGQLQRERMRQPGSARHVARRRLRRVARARRVAARRDAVTRSRAAFRRASVH